MNIGGLALPGSMARPSTRLGRGYVASRFAGGGLGPRSRRVVVKSRLVPLRAAGPRSIARHLSYLARDGVSADGSQARAYGPQTDDADLAAFEARGGDDRHQFRFIVAPEDAAELGDLHDYTRALMSQVQTDLGTRLDWVAVDHWDTDNPHTHVVLRGRTEEGPDLVIARDYISHGMRRRASELATEWLGLRTDREMRQALDREVEQARWTTLDRQLVGHAQTGQVRVQDIERNPVDPARRQRLVGRLQRLATMGLAEPLQGGAWRLSANLEASLRAQGERGDIIRTLQRTFTRERRELAIFDDATAVAPVVGRIAAKGLHDELTGQGYLVLDGIDGRGHYVRLPAGAELGDWPLGGIAEVVRRTQSRADRAIAQQLRDGLYQPQAHRDALVAAGVELARAQGAVTAYVRRLEALRRAGVVERKPNGTWRVPADLVRRGKIHDQNATPTGVVSLRSAINLAQQVQALGATWLDRTLAAEIDVQLGPSGFGAEVTDALTKRAMILKDRGLDLRNTSGSLRVAALRALTRAELQKTGAAIAAQTGMAYRELEQDVPFAGIYRRRLDLVSGRFALLDDGLGFVLVPWRPVVEKQTGRLVTVTSDAAGVQFRFSRQLGR